MLRKFPAALILLFMVVWTPFFSVGGLSYAGAPKLVSDVISYNFGEVYETQKVETTFILSNLGDESLTIQKIESSCGCTTTKLGGTVIPPGGSTNLTATMNLRGRRGGQNKSIYIYSNDPQQPQMILKMEGHVLVEVDVVPKRVDFLDIDKNKTAQKTVKIVNVSGPPLHITRIENSGAFYQVRQTTLEDGKSYQLDVETIPPLSEGIIRGVIKVYTDNPRHSSIQVPVSVRVASDIVVAPRVIAIPYDGKEGSPSNFFVAVRSRDRKPFSIIKVEPPDPEIKVKINLLDSGYYKLEISNVVPSNRLNGKYLTIFTDMQSKKEIRVPLQIYRRRQSSRKDSFRSVVRGNRNK